MKCSEIITILEKKYPPCYAVEWDNVGLLVGDEDKEVKTVFTALDLTDEILSQAIESGADMIVTHHPLLFRPVSRITRQDFIGRRIISLIEHGISYYAMHTNFDVKGMADRNAADLGLINPVVLEKTTENEEGKPEGFGRVGRIGCFENAGNFENLENFENSENSENSENINQNSVKTDSGCSLGAYAAFVKKIYGLDQIRVYGDPEKTVRVCAVSSGSGKSSIPDALKAGADVIITGDVDYHTAIDANMKGIAVIDAGHYGTEFCFIDEAASYLAESCPELTIRRAEVINPYHIF